MKLEILTFPNPVLKSVSRPVVEFNAELKTLAENLLETMYDAPGVGLAAIQVGIAQRILVIDVDFELEELPDGSHRVLHPNPRIFVNPKILSKSGETIYQEGCLSVPGVYEEVKRAAQIEVEYQNLDGERQVIRAGEGEGERLLSVCLQHEIDHLEGKLFIERLSPIKAKMTKKKLLKEAKAL